MEELIQQYISESSALIAKQASEIVELRERVSLAEARSKMDKEAAEGTLCDLIDCLGKGQYSQESIIKALREKNTDCLKKESAEEVIDDWGSLEETVSISNNIRPSEQKLYANLGLI